MEKDSGKKCRRPLAGCCLEEWNLCGMIVQSSVSLTWPDYVPCQKGAFGPEPKTSKRFIFSEKKKKEKKRKLGVR